MIVLDWPPAVLSPNARKHWSVVAAAKKKYFADCFNLTRLAKISSLPDGPIHLHITLIRGNHRRFDQDNAIASLKAGFDDMAAALKVDDSRFVIAGVLSMVSKPARIEIVIT